MTRTEGLAPPFLAMQRAGWRTLMGGALVGAGWALLLPQAAGWLTRLAGV